MFGEFSLQRETDIGNMRDTSDASCMYTGNMFGIHLNMLDILSRTWEIEKGSLLILKYPPIPPTPPNNDTVNDSKAKSLRGGMQGPYTVCKELPTIAG